MWKQLQAELKHKYNNKINVQSVLGGLAPDTDEPMSEDMRSNILDNWRTIQKHIPGTSFNYDFWRNCKPRRSTYASCRAVLASGMQLPASEENMVAAIQRAYYLQARNPSDDEVLIELAGEIGLDQTIFSDHLNSEKSYRLLDEELKLTRDLGVSSFPSLVFKTDNEQVNIPIDYNDSNKLLHVIEQEI